MNRGATLLLLSGLLLGSCWAFAAANQKLSTEDLSGQRLRSVVELYRSVGYEIYYSKSLVPSRYVVTSNPPTEEPLVRLNTLLEEFELRLRQSSSSDSFLIVKLSPETLANRIVVCISPENERLPGARVKTKSGQSVFTNTAGEAYLEASSEFLAVEHSDYEYLGTNSELSKTECTHLLRTPQSIEEIVVSSSRYRFSQLSGSKATLDEDDLANTAELGGDVMRIVNRLPGMGSLGVSAKPYIRGGSQDELLVLFNGVELIEPFHLKDFQSIFSGLNPNVVGSIDIYTGGFPARYGNRMSGVMDVSSKQNEEGANAEIGVSVFATHGYAANTFADGRGRWSAAARRGNLDWVTRKVNPEAGDPSYYDAYGLLDYITDGDVDLQVGWLTYNDDVALRSLDNNEGRAAQSVYKNHYLWTAAQYSLGDISAHSLLSYARIRNKRRGTLNDPNPDEGIGFVDDDKNHRLIRLKQRFEAAFGEKQRVEFGLGVEYQKASYRYNLDASLGELSVLLGSPQRIVRTVDVNPDGFTFNAYGSHVWKITDRWATEWGIRWDRQNYYFGTSEQQISPRFSLLYESSPQTKWRFSAGKFNQPEGIHELQVEFSQLGYQKSQSSQQYILGLEHQFNTSLQVRVETYYKKIKRPKRRFENLFNPFILVPELSPDRLTVEALEVRARGVEVSLTYEQDQISAWFGGTFASVDDRLAEIGWTARAWDQRAAISAGIRWEGDRWSLGMGTTWHSGWKTSSYRNEVEDLTQPLLIDRNREELPNYFSFDVRLARRWQWSRQSLEIFAEVTNISDRTNIGAVEAELESNTDNSFAFDTENEELFPRIPSAGFIWRFH